MEAEHRPRIPAIRRRRAPSPAAVGRLAAWVTLSLLLHGTALGLAWYRTGTPGAPAPPAPRMVLLELDPVEPPLTAADLPFTEDIPVDRTAERLAELEAAHAAAREEVEVLTTRVAEVTGQLETERGRAARVEAERRQEIVALETARAQLGDEVAALTTDREELSARLTAERERARALEEELAARRAREAAALAELQATHDRLVAALQREIAAKEVALRQAREGLTVSIVDRVLFPSGRASLTPEGRRVMDKVARALAAIGDRRILIEGHTDDVPIGPELRARFPSNWELSTARATEVVKYLVGEAKLSPERLTAAGRADTRPVASNAHEEGRQENRRIEIILLPPGAEKS